MVQVQTKLKAADNSGARWVQCIKALKGFNRTYAYCGDFILISVKNLRLIRKVKVGEIHLGVISRIAKETHFLDGSFSKFNKNALIILNKKKRVLGTRLFGWLSRKLRRKKFLRILILCGHSLI
jgi:large subunit ribosomal protein L14